MTPTPNAGAPLSQERVREPMRKPQFRRDDECSGCLEFRPLILPVRWVSCYDASTSGSPLWLCLACRLGIDDNSDGYRWGMPGYRWDYLPNQRPQLAAASR